MHIDIKIIFTIGILFNYFILKLTNTLVFIVKILRPPEIQVLLPLSNQVLTQFR